jgi:hypothetical protein
MQKPPSLIKVLLGDTYRRFKVCMDFDVMDGEDETNRNLCTGQISHSNRLNFWNQINLRVYEILLLMSAGLLRPVRRIFVPFL